MLLCVVSEQCFNIVDNTGSHTSNSSSVTPRQEVCCCCSQSTAEVVLNFLAMTFVIVVVRRYICKQSRAALGSRDTTNVYTIIPQHSTTQLLRAFCPFLYFWLSLLLFFFISFSHDLRNCIISGIGVTRLGDFRESHHCNPDSCF